MIFPYFHKYVEMITTRDHIVLVITFCVVFACSVVLWIRFFRPSWFRLATWVVGVGGFYATLVFWIVYSLNHS